jgi:hypothetical protein
MATDKNTLKSWFKTGLKPTQLQFWAWMDSYFHKDEAIPQNSISGLQQVLNAKAEKTQLEAHLSDPDAHSELLSGTEKKENKGIAGGYAPLDEFSKIAHQYLSIVNNLTSGGASAMLSAEQGVVLQNQINAINALLSSDNVNLDTFQEIVDAIESIQNTAGTVLVNDLTTGGETKALTAEMGRVLNEIKLTAILATDAETQINAAVTEDNKVISRLKLFNWWGWQKTLAQVFGSSVKAQSFNTGTYINLNLYSADFTASATKRISIDAVNARIVGQNGASTTLIYFDPTPTSNNIYFPNATGRVLLDSTLKDVYLNNFQKTTFSPMYLRVNNSGSDVVEDLRINVASGNNRPFFERCILANTTKGTGTWERTITTIKINNNGAAQGAVAVNSTVDIQLTNATLFTWQVDTLASRTGAATSELLSANKVLDVDEKTTNTFRITMEFSYAAGGADGTVDLAIVNPSNVIIDQESESINVDAAGATSKISVFRLFAVKTSDNNVGYILRMTVGAKALTGWRIKSILRTNN